MTATIRKIIFLFILATICSCNNASKELPEAESNDVVSDTSETTVQEETTERDFPENETIEDTITDIKFQELSISISRLLIYDEENKLGQVQKDTVNLYAEVGETIEEQAITVTTNQLSDIIIDQRYETSITIMNEGPHCDLTEWKHYYSDWKKLKTNGSGQFICDKYSETDSQKFPKISIDELKKEVKKTCGEEWSNQVEKVKSPTEYPSAIGISRYFLRISGKLIGNGKKVTKIIVIETPMGC